MNRFFYRIGLYTANSIGYDSAGAVVCSKRFTEGARRAVFFGRYQASKFGSRQMEPYHLLLGVVQAAADSEGRMFPPGLLRELEGEFAGFRSDAQIPTSVDLPLSISAKRALAYAGEIAERRKSVHIDLSDVLGGVMRADARVAEAMARRGIDPGEEVGGGGGS